VYKVLSFPNHNHKSIRTRILFQILIVVLLAIPEVFAQEIASPRVPITSQRPDSGEIFMNVTVNVAVKDKLRGYIQDLERTAFTIIDNKIPQEISSFSNEDAASVGIIFDTSASMAAIPDKIRPATKAVVRFIQSSNRANEYFLITVNQHPELRVDWTRDGNAILDKLEVVKGKGNTALYDACYLGIEKVKKGSYAKQVLLIISDGLDNDSGSKFKEVRRLLGESRVLVYSVSIANGQPDVLAEDAHSVLQELTSLTGGADFYPKNTAQAIDVLELIATELRHQYLIGFKPANLPQDRKWHRLKVKVVLPFGTPDERRHVSVRSREGYYAAAHNR
jgi:Ca-activated chloride channel family protein